MPDTFDPADAPALQDQSPAKPPTARQVRLEINRLESWWQAHETEFTPEQRVYMREMLEHAREAQHVRLMADIVRRWRKGTTGQTVEAA